MRLWLVAALAVVARAQSFDDITVERVITGYAYAESPVWSREGFFLWADVPANKLYKWTPGSPPVVFREPSNKAIGAAYDAKGNLYICESATGRLIRLPAKGEAEVVASEWEGKRLNSPNSVVVRKDGHLFFTDPAFGSAAHALDFNGIYHIDTDDRRAVMTLVAKHKSRPNGIALSPDGKVLYVAISDEHAIYAYDVDNKGGTANQRVLIADIAGVPGGMATDEKGNLYVAAKGVQIFSAAGKLIRSIEFVEQPSDVIFGGPNGNLLLVTAGPAVYMSQMPVKGTVPYN